MFRFGVLGIRRKYRHEIIEFPVVFVNAETLEADGGGGGGGGASFFWADSRFRVSQTQNLRSKQDRVLMV